MQGYQVGITKQQFEGSVDVPSSASAQASASFSTEFFFAGGRGPHVKKQFARGDSDAFTIDDPVATLWSTCGTTSTVLRTSTAVIATAHDDTSDAVDIRLEDDALVYSIQVRAC